MLLDLLADYLTEVEAALRSLKDCHFEKYHEEILTPQRVNLRIRIRFSHGDLLEINEAVIVESNKVKHLSYRYHLQDKKNELIFRYDNTPHFPDLETFPHHKHLPTKVISIKKPSVTEVTREVNEHVAARK